MAAFVYVCIFLFSHLMVMVNGDCYFHNPRGSNNRLKESSANRRNGKRMFDSQNNDKGGYNVGDVATQRNNRESLQYQMRYFQSDDVGGSYLDLEWTNQHGCGKNTLEDPIKLNCQVVLQYMCTPVESTTPTRTRELLRDGSSTSTNNYNDNDVERIDRDRQETNLKESERDFIGRYSRNDPNKGMNEPFQWRDKCVFRPRNKRLFTADQKVKDNQGAGATRQNPKGTRRGYECAEERDYYPYWHPSDWKDIAVLVENKTRCGDLQKDSFNVQGYGECVEKFKDGKEAHYSLANNKDDCENQRKGTWREYHNYLEKLLDGDKTPTTAEKCLSLADDAGLTKDDVKFDFAIYGTQRECLVKLKKPACEVAAYTRVNHLGNSDGLKASKYRWKLPYFPSGKLQKCVLRVRYNISTDDYDPGTSSDQNNNKTLISNTPQAKIGLANGQTLRLAINTAQTGRTFQDRSHVFYMKEREAGMEGKEIHNLNVRGKRGNIVQTYPAVEYDFVPNDLTVGTDDAVHIQWTGSNSHNNGNPGGDGQTGDDGQGRKGTDRSNILGMSADGGSNFFMPLEHESNIAHSTKVMWAAKGGKNLKPLDVALQLASAGRIECLDCRSRNSLKRNNVDKLLNDAPASYEGIMLSFTEKDKEFRFGCTRNNNFSNRSQKARIRVIEGSTRR